MTTPSEPINQVHSKKYFNAFFENSQDAVMTLEPPSWKFTACNPSTLRMFVVPNEKRFTNFLPWITLSPKYQPDGQLSSIKAKKMITIAMRTGSNLFEWTHKRLNGSNFPASVLLTKVELPGKVYCQAIVRDVTENQKNLELIKSSEEKFRNIYEGSIDGILTAEIETKNILFGNKSICKLLGYNLNELSKLNISDIHPADAMSSVLGKFQKQLECEIATISDIPVLRKNGDIIYCDISARPITIENKKLMLGFFRDVTAKRKSRIMLEESEYFFKESQKVAHIGSYKLNIADNSWTSSAVLNDIFGINADYEKNFKNWLLIVHDQDRNMMKTYFENDVLVHHHTFNKEYRIRRLSDNAIRWVHGLGRVKYSRQNIPISMIGTIQDVTEKKLNEANLIEIKNRNESILESIGDAVFVVNIDGKIIIFNKIVAEMTKIPKSKAIGSHYSEIVNFVRDEDANKSVDIVAEALRNRSITTMSSHTLLSRKDGIKIPIADSAAPVSDIHGNLLGCVVVFHDMTKEYQIDKAKTEFVSLASHQLRTPLATINWYSEILLSEDLGKLSEQQKQYNQEVYHASQRMVQLVNALLNVSRLELGTFSVEPKFVDIIKILTTSINDLKPQLILKKIKIKEKYDSDLIKIKVDPKLMGMIFQNLLSNAVKYSRDEGKIEINISIKNDTVLIKIADNGIGIPKNQQREIFTKLYRADNAKNLDPDGTGLGLYIVKQIIDYTGGKIWFVSKEGKGAKFYASLPMSGMVKKTSNKQLI